MKKIAVLGAGSGGMAIAAKLAINGHDVRLWNRSSDSLEQIRNDGGINLATENEVRRIQIKTSIVLGDVVEDASVILVVTPAYAHAEMAKRLKSMLEPGQTVLLMPGRTGGALEVANILNSEIQEKSILVGESSTLPYACSRNGSTVNVFQEKSYLSIAAFPSIRSKQLTWSLKELFPRILTRANVLVTGLENIGAMFHPASILLNLGAIQSGSQKYLYREMTQEVLSIIQALDRERLAVAKVYRCNVLTINEWILASYPNTTGSNLYDYVRTCKAYSSILAPKNLNTRLIHEDVPTGLVPLFYLGSSRGVKLPVANSLIELAARLTDIDYWSTGRTFERIGLDGMSHQDISFYIKYGRMV